MSKVSHTCAALQRADGGEQQAVMPDKTKSQHARWVGTLACSLARCFVLPLKALSIAIQVSCDNNACGLRPHAVDTVNYDATVTCACA